MQIKNTEVLRTPNSPTPGRPVIFNQEKCTGCNICVHFCMEDIFVPAARKGELPIILYPEECWYCGNCVDDCPVPGAIALNHPLMQRVRWKRKATGEHFRVR
ncbi:MAG: ferredoxin family protein [Alphaproteobacteria bacterium]|jgi:NAD-dependent dihydropyrimidine dehydrogenase PreA subunit|nr:ferredoxin family protein [Alphaproteobacteria bacterium]MDP6563283.1 ferredoxin family protein [Alphaproteobacteria bacterium]MDP6812431.1 ferredoxin family protein [Alphaproteobacteria bacterium]|tara:strand:+ start:179 stop:484 length:306 start_codon:yes stop_codon:yes gene_type:complete